MTVPVPEGVKTWLEWQEQRKRIIREFMSINNLPPAPVVSPTCGSHSVSGMDMARPCEDRIACVIERYDEKAGCLKTEIVDWKEAIAPPVAPYDYEAAADEITALINRTPRSPTREEIIATLKGVVWG